MIHRQGTTKRYSDSTSFNGVVYLVEVPSTEEGDIQAQTRDLLNSLERMMAGAGTDKKPFVIGSGLFNQYGSRLRGVQCRVGRLVARRHRAFTRV